MICNRKERNGNVEAHCLLLVLPHFVLSICHQACQHDSCIPNFLKFPISIIADYYQEKNAGFYKNFHVNIRDCFITRISIANPLILLHFHFGELGVVISRSDPNTREKVYHRDFEDLKLIQLYSSINLGKVLPVASNFFLLEGFLRRACAICCINCIK